MAMSAQPQRGLMALSLRPLSLPLLSSLLLTVCLCSSGSSLSWRALARSHPDSSTEIMIRPFVDDLEVSKGRLEAGEGRLEEGKGDSAVFKGSLAWETSNSDIVGDGEWKGGEDGLESMPAGRGGTGGQDLILANKLGASQVFPVFSSASFPLEREWQRYPQPDSDKNPDSLVFEEDREGFSLSSSGKWGRRMGRRLLGKKKKVRRRRKSRVKNEAENEEKAKGGAPQAEEREGGAGDRSERRKKKEKERVKDRRSSRGEEVGGDEVRGSGVEGGDGAGEREASEGRRGVEQRKVVEDRGHGVGESAGGKDDSKTRRGKRKIRRKGEEGEEKEDGEWNEKTRKQRSSEEEERKNDSVRGERGGRGRGKRKGREGKRRKGASLEETTSGDLREDGVGDAVPESFGRKGRGEEDQGGDRGRGGKVSAQEAREGNMPGGQGRDSRKDADEGRARELVESKSRKDGGREGSRGQSTAGKEEGVEKEGKGTADNADEEGKGLADSADEEGKGLADSRSNVVEDKVVAEITQGEGQREEELGGKASKEEGLREEELRGKASKEEGPREEGVREEVRPGVVESDEQQSSGNGVGEEIAREADEPSVVEPMPAALQADETSVVEPIPAALQAPQQNQQENEPEEQRQQQQRQQQQQVLQEQQQQQQQHDHSALEMMNSGAQAMAGAQGMGVADRGGPEMGRGKSEEEGLPLLSAEEQLEIERQAHEDDERYVSFMSEAMGIRHRLSPTLYAFKEKTKKLVLPKIVSFAKSTRAALAHTSKTLTHRLHPYVGSSYSPALATILSYTLLILPFVLLAFLFNQVRVILSLRRAVLLCNMYLVLYCAGLLVTSVIISAEPMASLRAAAETNFYVLQIVQAAGYVSYLILQAMHASAVWRKRKEREQDVRFPLLKAVVQLTMATGVGLHYYVTVFERAMLDQTPQTGAAAYLLYCMTFAVLTLLARADGKRNDKQR